MTLPESLQKAAETAAEKHMSEYFKRNDLPGPGSTHNQIFQAGFTACLKLLWPAVEALEYAKGQLEHAGYVKNAVPTIERALTSLRDRLK